MDFDVPLSTSVVLDASALEASTAFLTRHEGVCRLEDNPHRAIDNAYFRARLPGTHREVFCREAVAILLTRIEAQLPAGMRLRIFDAFRTIETQIALFEQFSAAIAAAHPDLSAQALRAKVLTFVSWPSSDVARLPYHNSGGAVDLTLMQDGVDLDMGTDFDAPTDSAATDFFERPFDAALGFEAPRFERIRKNRRLLYHLMTQQGFVNLASEWWHYSIGERLWGEVHGCAPVFASSIETQVLHLVRHG